MKFPGLKYNGKTIIEQDKDGFLILFPTGEVRSSSPQPKLWNGQDEDFRAARRRIHGYRPDRIPALTDATSRYPMNPCEGCSRLRVQAPGQYCRACRKMFEAGKFAASMVQQETIARYEATLRAIASL